MANKVAVIGSGGWGTALSIVSNVAGNSVTLWTRTPEKAEMLRQSRENQEYLPGVVIPEEICITNDIEKAITNASIVLFVVPAQAVRDTVFLAKPLLRPEQTILVASKGIERTTQMLMSQVVSDVLDDPRYDRIGVLSGPNHAEEVARQIPSTTVISSLNHEAAQSAQQALISRHFRIYTNNDMIGVQVAGAMKNVIALAAGMSDGLGFGDNTKAALMTRGLTEIARLGVAQGAKALTFSGLAGMGDLIATCTSRHSRNARAGRAIGSGQTLQQVLDSTKMVVEGVWTTEAAYRLGQQTNVEIPITIQVHSILFEGKKPLQAVVELMERDPIGEEESYILSSYLWRG